MCKNQKNKKQTEELNSSKIKEILLQFTQAMRCIEAQYSEGKASDFETHVSLASIFNETSRKITDTCSLFGYIEPVENLLSVEDFFVQSGIEMTPDSTSGADQIQNVGFSKEETVIADIPHPMAYTKVDTSQNVELGDYLSRPVQIHTKSWQIGTTIDAATENFRPWHLFFNHPSIKRKLDNYYMVRCNLHLKFVINASPFYYGCAIAAYQPLPVFNPAPVVLSAADRLENVSFSQRPHIYLYPQDSQGGEMVLPFLYHKNWLDATSATDLTDMGIIDINSFGTLLNANGLTTDSINIVVYAWADSVEVAGPTSSLAVQAKDEYSHEGTVSKPASAIARAAGYLSTIPVIGPFATATSYAAGAVADIASLFGYTNVPVIDDVHAYRNTAFPNQASTDIGTPVEKLTLDSKNELTIDAKVAGADVDDELLIKSFAGRESFIFESTWAAADTIDTGLFYAKVTPSIVRYEAGTNQTIAWGTPSFHLGHQFSYWRGDMIYRFKFICTKYHRGRVRINWDPHGAIGTSGNYTTETYTKIVDISEETDVEFRVPYTQTTAYLESLNANVFSVAQASTNNSGMNQFFNGILTMRVLNMQTSPVTSADIKILTFSRCAENIEFAAPRQVSNLISPYVVQSGLEVSSCELGVKPSVADPNINLVYMGEHCLSVRQLMRRSVQYLRTVSDSPGGIDRIFVLTRNLSRSPLYPGYDTTGLHGATGLTSAVAETYNWVNWTPSTWFSMCFVGSRGSYVYSVNNASRDNSKSVKIARSEKTHDASTWSTDTIILAATYPYVLQANMCDSVTHETGCSGMAITNQQTQSGLTAHVPMYSRYKFLSNNVTTRTAGSTADNSNTDSVNVEVLLNSELSSDADTHHTDLYAAVGTDFNLIFFLNVPATYTYTSLPVAAVRP